MRSLIPALTMALALTSVLVPTSADGQTFTRRDVPRGEVTGLEMGVEGNLQAVSGGRLRWFVTVYEIVKGRELRPAARTQLKVLASFQRSAPVTEVVTDDRGRASLEFAIPDTVIGGFNLVVEARSPRKVKRDFDVYVSLVPRYHTELFVDRDWIPPGATIQAWGRVIDRAKNRPVLDREVQVLVTSEQRMFSDTSLRTDAQGLFSTRLKAPDGPTKFSVTARVKGAPNALRRLNAKRAELPELVVTARPERDVVAPGTTVQVDVVVRTPDGRPVPRAALTGLSIPEPESERRPDKARKEIKPVLTDARGRARVPWKIKGTADIEEIRGQVSALREGIGTGYTNVRIRSARIPVIVSFSVEGGALIPELPNRVFVQAFHPDGTPWADLPTRIVSGQIVAPAGVTGKDGAAVFEATVKSADASAPSACRGPTVAAATLHLGPHRKSLCLPVDPDATVRVRSAPKVIAGTNLPVELFAASAVARSPIAVTVLSRANGSAWHPLAQSLVAGGGKRATLAIPAEAAGELWIRARPLIGGELQEVRGGTALVWSAPRHGHAVRVRPDKSGAVDLDIAGLNNPAGSALSATGFALALPVKRGRKLLKELRHAADGQPPPDASDALWQGYLAARTPVDNAVSAVLRAGARATLAMPEDAVAMGLLRDPWRSRARFVRGRLGRLMLAVESHVAENLPDSIANVAVRGPRGWRFNSEILTVLAQDLGVNAVAGLDGSPLTIKSLQALDGHFVYDNVARRLTRKRLLRLLIALRHFVQTEKLDYEWARRGDPTTWLGALREWDEGDLEFDLERTQFFDGWGQPFIIRKARGARARFRFLEPIVGYELISAGPDGRFGTRDDVFNPFARVLPRTSLYGEAVGEEALLARLQGVELGRATIAALNDAFGLHQPSWESSEQTGGTLSWTPPKRTADTRAVLAAQTVGPALSSTAAFQALATGSTNSATTRIDLPLSSEPRHYMIVAGTYGADGVAAFAAEPLQAGAPVLIDATLPPRLRPGEPLQVPVHLIGIGARQALSVSARGDGPITANVLGETKFSLEAGQSHTVQLRISAARVGSGRLQLTVATGDGRTIREFTRELPVMWDGSLRAQHTGALVTQRAQLEVRPPADARPVRAFLAVSAPRDVMRDPGFKTLQQRHPALLGWAYSLRGEEMPKSLIAELARRDPGERSPATTIMPALDNACAAVSFSAFSDADSPGAHTRWPGGRRALSRLRSTTAPASLRERSALLVALASNAAMLGSAGATDDPVINLVASLRRDGWHAPRTERNRPTMMARLAAGLLLSNPRDVPGLELFNLGRAALVAGPRGGKVLPGENGRAVDGWIGTVALAIAARQLGEDKLATELVRGLAPRLYLATDAGPEPAFWLLAASVYGVFGIDAPKHVTVVINGTEKRVELKRGVASVPLPDKRVRVVVQSEQPVLARLEARYVRPVRETADNSLIAKLTGDVGYTGDTAALEVTLTNDGAETIVRPVLEIALPSAADFSESTRRSIASTDGVVRVEMPDALGLLRIHLTPLAGQQRRRVPLPVRWVGTGQVKGLSLSVYDADQPWRISSTPSRTVSLKPRPVETWK